VWNVHLPEFVGALSDTSAVTRTVRLLHTSDWHLGRSLHGESLIEEQRAFLDWLVALAGERAVDAVLVAGDVYDRAVPPTDAVLLLDQALAAFARAGIAVVVSSGNHDSAIRLGFGSRLAASAQIHLRTRLEELTSPLVIDDLGIYAIPYLLPDAVAEQLHCDRSHRGVLGAATQLVREDAAARGLARTVVLAHAFVTGGAASDSERDISVGGIGDVAASVFSGFSYVALGHLHGAQQVAPNARYSGSPLPFSFSERHHTKAVSVVEIDEAGGVSVEPVPTPVPRVMAELTGELAALLASQGGPPADAWLRVVLTDVVRPADPMQRLRERWPHTLVLEHRPPVSSGDSAADIERLRTVTDPVEVCSLFVEWVDSSYPDGRQRDALASVVEAVRRAEQSA
jgi:exonuclease SbcD